MFNIVLLNPQIPQNTGTIGRTCVAMGACLHLIKPYGFEISEKKLRRAGLDYWQNLNYKEYENLDEFYKQNKNKIKCIYFLSTKAKNSYYEKTYNEGDFFMFGREDAGINEDILNQNQNNCIKIPMKSIARSLNLSNAVCIVLYEALRQNINNFNY